MKHPQCAKELFDGGDGDGHEVVVQQRLSSEHDSDHLANAEECRCTEALSSCTIF